MISDRENLTNIKIIEVMELDIAMALKSQLLVSHAEPLVFARVLQLIADLRVMTTNHLEDILNSPVKLRNEVSSNDDSMVDSKTDCNSNSSSSSATPSAIDTTTSAIDSSPSAIDTTPSAIDSLSNKEISVSVVNSTSNLGEPNVGQNANQIDGPRVDSENNLLVTPPKVKLPESTRPIIHRLLQSETSFSSNYTSQHTESKTLTILKPASESTRLDFPKLYRQMHCDFSEPQVVKVRKGSCSEDREYIKPNIIEQHQPMGSNLTQLHLDSTGQSSFAYNRDTTNTGITNTGINNTGISRANTVDNPPVLERQDSRTTNLLYTVLTRKTNLDPPVLHRSPSPVDLSQNTNLVLGVQSPSDVINIPHNDVINMPHNDIINMTHNDVMLSTSPPESGRPVLMPLLQRYKNKNGESLC